MFIGIDLGTSGVKLILVKKDGTIVKTVSRSYEVIIPKPSWTEQNPDDWYDQTFDGLKELVKDYESEITGIGFSGQMHGLVLLDRDDNILRNALLWNDQRTIKEVEYLNHGIGIDNLLQYTGNIALTGLTAPKLIWVRDNEPELFKKIDKIMLPKDYLIYKLSGEYASDVSDLSGTLFFDPKTKTYSQEMLDVLEVDETDLPEIHESYEIVGSLKRDIRKSLGIRQDVRIIAGGGDQAVGAVGVGIVEEGGCSISLGTSGVIFVASKIHAVDNQSYLQSYAHANGEYHIMAVMLNAAGTVKWWNERINQNDDYPSFYEKLTNTNPEEKLFFLPYLSGERAPINDPYSKGVLFGLASHHTKEDIDRAIVEGISFALRDSFELIKNLDIPIIKARITGGGAKSDVWAQMISDVLGVEVEKIEAEEGPALGAAILAMVGCHAYPSVKDACKHIVKVKQTFKPNARMKHLYDEKYEDFIKLYPQMKALYKDIYS